MDLVGRVILLSVAAACAAGEPWQGNGRSLQHAYGVPSTTAANMYGVPTQPVYITSEAPGAKSAASEPEEGSSIDSTLVAIVVIIAALFTLLSGLLCSWCWARRRTQRRKQQQTPELLKQGISLDWVLSRFAQEAAARYEASLNQKSSGVGAVSSEPGKQEPQNVSDLNFHQLRDIVARGQHAFGYQKKCPRDGRQHCSIIDAVSDDGHSARATLYVSWVWSYTLKQMLSALQDWKDRQPEHDVQKHHLWWCFCCTNQFRLQDGRAQAAQLADHFAKQLTDIGRMVIVFDSARAPQNTGRLWCLFEVFNAQKHPQVRVEAALAEGGKEEFEQVAEEGLAAVSLQVKSESAKATHKEDELALRRLIQSQGSFSALDSAVSLALEVLYADVFKELLQRRGVAADSTSIDVNMPNSEPEPETVGQSFVKTTPRGSERMLMHL